MRGEEYSPKETSSDKVGGSFIDYQLVIQEYILEV